MWLAIHLPAIAGGQASGRLAKLHARVGDRLEPGDVLADVTIDLSAGIARDCPPVSTCRIVLRETAWLRALNLSAEEPVPPGGPIALLSDDPVSPPEAPSRAARITVATILHHEDWWVTPQ